MENGTDFPYFKAEIPSSRKRKTVLGDVPDGRKGTVWGNLAEMLGQSRRQDVQEISSSAQEVIEPRPS